MIVGEQRLVEGIQVIECSAQRVLARASCQDSRPQPQGDIAPVRIASPVAHPRVGQQKVVKGGQRVINLASVKAGFGQIQVVMGHARYSSLSGSHTEKVVPLSGSLSRTISPPCISTISRVMLRPRPTPAL